MSNVRWKALFLYSLAKAFPLMLEIDRDLLSGRPICMEARSLPLFSRINESHCQQWDAEAPSIREAVDSFSFSELQENTTRCMFLEPNQRCRN